MFFYKPDGVVAHPLSGTLNNKPETHSSNKVDQVTKLLELLVERSRREPNDEI